MRTTGWGLFRESEYATMMAWLHPQGLRFSTGLLHSNAND
jgi:hypothetical protein